jgi:hypothetical protein
MFAATPSRGVRGPPRSEATPRVGLFDPGRVVLVDDHHAQDVGVVGEVGDGPGHELDPVGPGCGELERAVKVAGEVQAEQGRGHGGLHACRGG